MLNVGQLAATRAAFSLAGFDGDLKTLPVDSEDERLFLLDPADYAKLQGIRELEQVLTQLLGRKCSVVAHQQGWAPVPFSA